MKKILILGGAGTMGSEAAKLLLERSDAQLTIADYSAKGLKRIEAELGNKVKTAIVDVTQKDELVKLLKTADIAISTVGPFYKFATTILKAAIEAHINIVDIDDDFDATNDSLALDEAAKKAGVTAIIGMGASPGMTNLIAKLGADRLDSTHTIRFYWGESALDPTGPAAMVHWFHITSEKVPAFIDGKWVDVHGFSEPEEVEFMQPLGKQMVIYTGHPEPVSLPRYIKGLKHCTIKGCLYPAKMMDLYGQLIETGFGSRSDFIINENTTMPFRELAVKIIRNMPRLAPAYFTDILNEALQKYQEIGGAFKIVVSGKKGNQDQTITYDMMAHNVARSTALPAVIAALNVLDGKVKQSGVMAPEGALDARAFMDLLAKDAKVVETVTTVSENITYK